MYKIVFTIILTVIGVVFTIQNSDHVDVQLLVGSPKQIRLIFLLLIFFFAGFFVAYIYGLQKEHKLKSKVRLLQNGHSQRQSASVRSFEPHRRSKEEML